MCRMTRKLLSRNSSTFPKSRLHSLWSITGWVSSLLLLVLGLTGSAQALDPERAVPDYKRDRWDSQRGFAGGQVYAITQTPDGYLWIGAEEGLVRFDGVNFRLFNHANTAVLRKGRSTTC